MSVKVTVAGEAVTVPYTVAAGPQPLVVGVDDPAGRVGVYGDLVRHDGDVIVTRNGQLVQGLDIYGIIRLGSFSGVVIDRCHVRGPDITGTSAVPAIIMSNNDDLRGAVIRDSTIEGGGSMWAGAVRGGNYRAERVHVTNVPDGFSLTSVLGNVTLEACWIHHGLYGEWAVGTPVLPTGGNCYTHADGVQFHRGKNYLIRGCHIGGRRANDPLTGKAYLQHTGHAADINAGDDLYNSALMIKQEVDDTAANKIENVLIERNWLEGGTATVNMAGGRGNLFESLTVRDNIFPRAAKGAVQFYILRTPGVGVFIGNVHEDGAPVAISRGA